MKQAPGKPKETDRDPRPGDVWEFHPHGQTPFQRTVERVEDGMIHYKSTIGLASYFMSIESWRASIKNHPCHLKAAK